MRVYRRAPPGYQFPLPLYRPTRRSLASWFGSACFFGLKLLASGLAGVLVATALWHDQWKSASAPAAVGKEIAAYSNPGETTVFYGEDSNGKRNSASSIRESVKRLKMLSAEGKPVFVVEYPRNDKQAQTARREISEQGFIGLMARRALNAL
jgi:hypothetical protein